MTPLLADVHVLPDRKSVARDLGTVLIVNETTDTVTVVYGGMLITYFKESVLITNVRPRDEEVYKLLPRMMNKFDELSSPPPPVTVDDALLSASPGPAFHKMPSFVPLLSKLEPPPRFSKALSTEDVAVVEWKGRTYRVDSGVWELVDGTFVISSYSSELFTALVHLRNEDLWVELNAATPPPPPREPAAVLWVYNGSSPRVDALESHLRSLGYKVERHENPQLGVHYLTVPNEVRDSAREDLEGFLESYAEGGKIK